jgi:hypothetical protein
MGFAVACCGAAAYLENIDFFERAFIKEQMDALPGGEFPPQMLDVDAFHPASGEGLLAQLEELENIVVHNFNHQLLLRYKQ